MSEESTIVAPQVSQVAINVHAGIKLYFQRTNFVRLVDINEKEIKTMESEKAEYLVALIAEFAAHYGITTDEAERYLSQYKAIELFDRQYGYLHT